MRRPSPIPPPTPRRREPEKPPAPQPVRSFVPDAPAPPEPEVLAESAQRDNSMLIGAAEARAQDDQLTAPITPLFERMESSATDRVPEVSESDVDADGDGSQSTFGVTPAEVETSRRASAETQVDARPPVRTIDVWRAARARRRALRTEIRRFTERSRRRRRVLWGWVAAVVVVAAASFGVAYSPLFAVETITVVGVKSLDADAVATALDSQRGRALASVDASEVKVALAAFPLIETYTLEAHPPHDLVVRIVERTPVGVIENDTGFTVVDAAGVTLSTSAERPAGYALLVLDDGVKSAVFADVGRVMRTLPTEIRARVTEAAASTIDDVTLRLDNGTEVVWGSPDESALKAVVLEESMAAHPDADVYDVSSPRAVVVR